MREHGVALSGRTHFAVGQLLGPCGQYLLRTGNTPDRPVDKPHINGKASIVDCLVQVPQRQLVALVIPHRQFLGDFAHG